MELLIAIWPREEFEVNKPVNSKSSRTWTRNDVNGRSETVKAKGTFTYKSGVVYEDGIAILSAFKGILMIEICIDFRGKFYDKHTWRTVLGVGDLRPRFFSAT